jgi:hypothetical protein
MLYLRPPLCLVDLAWTNPAGGADGRKPVRLTSGRESMPALIGLYVSDVDAVEAEFGRPDGEPPYGCEFELRDPDGNRLRIRRLAS